jgi:hypothetical protein
MSTFELLCQWVDIMVLVIDVQTWTNVIIINPTRGNLVLHVVLFRGVATIVVIYLKDGLYHD